MPKGSCREGRTKTSAAAYASASRGESGGNPGTSVTRPSRPSAFARVRIFAAYQSAVTGPTSVSVQAGSAARRSRSASWFFW